jgi:hypothetical protein
VAALALTSPILGPPRVDWPAAADVFRARNRGGYSGDEVTAIVWAYATFAPTIVLDPLVPLSQLALETGWLSSWWSAPGRHNPAGIGVTGASGAGVAFPSWIDSVRAHMGRLLAYASRPHTRSPRQASLVIEALTWRSLPPDKHGVSPRVGDLAGTWAADRRYGEKLVQASAAIVAGV